VLAQRLDLFLDTNQQLMRVVPNRHMNWRPPERKRTLRNLGYHVFRLSLAFVDAMDMGEFPESWLLDEAPADMTEWLLDEAPADLTDGQSIAHSASLVRESLTGRVAGASHSALPRALQTNYGSQ